MKATYQSWPDLNQSFTKLKTEIMNAREARTITEAKKRPLSDILNSVRLMAEAGNAYAAFDPKQLHDPIDMRDKLQEMGYTIEITDTNFKITW